MEKLIDAGKLKKEIEAWGYGLTYKDCLNEIEKAPIVNAIPIEWIKAQAYKYEVMDDYGNDVWKENLKWLLEDWGKENETEID